MTPMTQQRFEEVFGPYVVRDSASGCWLWRGPARVDGHPKVMRVDGRLVGPAKAAYEAHTGREVDSLCEQLLRTCQTGGCIAPAHRALIGAAKRPPAAVQADHRDAHLSVDRRPTPPDVAPRLRPPAELLDHDRGFGTYTLEEMLAVGRSAE